MEAVAALRGKRRIAVDSAVPLADLEVAVRPERAHGLRGEPCVGLGMTRTLRADPGSATSESGSLRYSSTTDPVSRGRCSPHRKGPISHSRGRTRATEGPPRSRRSRCGGRCRGTGARVDDRRPAPRPFPSAPRRTRVRPRAARSRRRAARSVRPRRARCPVGTRPPTPLEREARPTSAKHGDQRKR